MATGKKVKDEAGSQRVLFVGSLDLSSMQKETIMKENGMIRFAFLKNHSERRTKKKKNV